MRVALTTLLIVIFCSPLAAETINISDKLTLHFDLPGGWASNQQPPQFLIDEMAEHLKHNAELKGQSPTREQLQSAARKRFSNNEGLLYNSKTHSFLSLDFSRLRQGEKPPSHNSIKLSARYAGESLGSEEGVSDLITTISSMAIPGAWSAQRLDASYKHHDKPLEFIGVVGFASPYWFYFYYTDYLADEQDRKKAESLLKSVQIKSR